ncbi:3-hydroxyacyl-[acyl-carrier-protein] dehydratase FabZ [Pirellulimonas nuda]|uniref:3-hydroxyacyl-[acyl-carrier-protein] dehydratase FabZ n=1 Tax=Pirellulimonas nuda TaxID=2528009 RepID=A0A518DIV7_9BACT|nr:3-hydroxyacyl-ACP dehydratase FabZ family protein [Pirellulimonas nuda]QDU91415.1 3-hydroxyacyl-[acyl-carrier-protein] dehydratase FabZ [Pirellulimonas nuda]
MRFCLLDVIERIEGDRRLVAVKNVSYSEEYLQDHFPEFPVLPGVFMLEAATQASAWLLRISSDYAHSVINLKEAKNVKYAGFVTPGNRLRVEVEVIKRDERLVTLKVNGSVDGAPTLSGRLVLEQYNLGDADPEMAEVDARMRLFLQKWEKAIYRRPKVASSAA